jgi:DNA repair protein RadC
MRNFTNTDTIYSRRLQTIRLKVKRLYFTDLDIELQTVGEPADVYEILRVIYSKLDDDQEHLILLILNISNEVTGYKLISSGSQDKTLVDPRILFRNALLLGAARIIIAHNHPSGKLRASRPDLTVTKRVTEAGKILDVEVLDHIIYTPKGFLSMKSEHPEIF